MAEYGIRDGSTTTSAENKTFTFFCFSKADMLPISTQIQPKMAVSKTCSIEGHSKWEKLNAKLDSSRKSAQEIRLKGSLRFSEL